MVYRMGPEETVDYLAEYQRLQGIASWELSHTRHGDFLRCFLEAFLRADMFNAALLIPVMLVFVKKYGLKDETPGEV